jgi:predicted nucleotidyltransferase
MGSTAYGVAGDDSDSDLYGWCIPPKETIFPHLVGEIPGFGKQIQRFQQWQEHHVKDESSGKEYDFSVYNIVKFCQLCMENNPNICDALFVPERCVIHCSAVGNILRENRKVFLHRGCWHKFRGYAYSMLHKMSIKTPEPGSKRYELVKKFGYDIKFAYHLVRLLYEVEEILTTGDLHLDQNTEVLKAIRRGEWTQERIEKFFEQKEHALNTAYEQSKLSYGPRKKEIKELLLQCLEHHFGNLEKVVIEPDRFKNALTQIEKICYEILYKRETI